MNRSSTRIQPLILVMLLMTFTLGPAAADVLPVALERLVPPDPLAVLLVPSIDEFGRDIRELVRIFDEEAADDFDPFALLGDEFQDLELVLDPTAPAVAVLRFAPGNPQPLFSVIVPMRDPDLTVEDVTARLGTEPLAIRDGHMVLGSDFIYEPGDVRPKLMASMPSSDVSLRIDLAGIFEQFGPMLDMMVQMMLMQPGSIDSTGQVSEPMFGEDGVDQVLELIRLLREGVQTLEFAVNVEGKEVELAGGVAFTPGGPLELGPQPSLDVAWANVGLLDPDAMMLGASALDLSNLNPLIQTFYGILGSVQSDEIPDSPMAMFQQFQSFAPDLLRLYWSPFVMDASMGTDGFRFNALMEVGDPAAERELLLKVIKALEGTGVSVTMLDQRRVGGYDVSRHSIEYSLAEMVGPDEGLDAEHLAQAQQVLDELMGDWHLATGEGQVVMTLGASADELDDLLSRSAAGATGVPVRLERARAWAGPKAQAVWAADIGSLVGAVMAFVPTEGEDGADHETPDLDSLPEAPMQAMSEVDGAWLRGRLSVDLAAAAALFKAIAAY